jgi:hypothetical protein
MAAVAKVVILLISQTQSATDTACTSGGSPVLDWSTRKARKHGKPRAA